MKKCLKKAVAATLMLVMAVSLTACGGKKGGSQGVAEVSLDEEINFPLEQQGTLSFLTHASSTSTQEPNERTIFKRMEEKTNVHINWTCYTNDDFGDKKNLALASANSLPDGIFDAEMSDYDLLRYAKQGIIIPLEQYIDAYMPNLKKVFDDYPEYRAMCTTTDGHIYGFPWIEQLGEGKEAIQTVGGMPFINKTWLDELNIPMPTTTDELTAALKAFRDNDMAGGGKTIPMSFICNGGNEDAGVLFGAFGEGYGDTASHIGVSNDKKVVITATQEGYKQALIWMNELYNEGLIDPEAFTHEWSTYVAKGKEGRYGMCFTWDVGNIANLDDFVPLPALAGPDGMVNMPRQRDSATSGFFRGRCVLTSKCSNVPLACAWIDQMYDPIQSPQNNWGTYGDEGFNIFEYDAEKNFLTHAPLGDASPVEVREAQCVGGPLAVLNEYYGKYVTCPDDAQYRLDWIKDIYVKDMHQDYAYPNVFMDSEDVERCDQLTADIDARIRTFKSDSIMNGGVEANWDAYLKALNDYGLQEYTEIMQKYLDNYFKSLGE